MTVRFGQTRLHMHPLLPVLWCLVILSGQGGRVFPALLALCVHECGHILLAVCLKQRIDTIEITPLGGIITLKSPESLSPIRAFLLAAAGPVCSFLGCFAAPFLYEQGVFDFFMASAFLRSSVLLLLVNLLPALPLDGGRMTQALCALLFPNRKPHRALYFLGAAAGTALCLASILLSIQGRLVLAPMFAGLYLFYAASVENRQEPIRYMTALIGRRQKLDQEQALPVQVLAAGASAQAKKLLKNLSPGKYHVFLILSPDGTKPLGFIDESAYCDSILGNQNQTLGQIFQAHSEGRTKNRIL